MSWEERLKDGAYIAPSGKRIVFAYEDLTRTFDKKTSGFDFPDATGTYVQDLGRTGRKYPITAFFTGPDCDTAADEFEAALSETGRGRLEHPIYGTVDVVPYGTVTRSDALKTAANQSIVDVTFWETIPLIYPLPQSDPASEVLGGIRDLSGSLGESVADELDVFSPSAILTFKTRVASMVESADGVLGKATEIKEIVTAKVSNIRAQLDALTSPIIEAEKVFRRDVANIVDGLVDLMATPSSVTTSIKDKFNDYKNMIDRVVSPIYKVDSPAEYTSGRLMCECILGGLVVNIVESEFDTQGGAIESADDLLGVFDEVVEWEETEGPEVGIVDTGESYQRLHRAVALTAGYLVEISFTLKKERKIIVTRDRSIIDLVAELYGEVDERLDFFITSNNFSGSEILEIPQGREVLYYV